MEHIDRAEIFRTLCLRQQARIAGGLKLLDMRQEFLNMVKVAEAAHRMSLRQQYVPEARAEVLERLRERYGPRFPGDLGGRYLLGKLTDKLIAERYGL
jgi:hypothetical protein